MSFGPSQRFYCAVFVGLLLNLFVGLVNDATFLFTSLALFQLVGHLLFNFICKPLSYQRALFNQREVALTLPTTVPAVLTLCIMVIVLIMFGPLKQIIDSNIVREFLASFYDLIVPMLPLGYFLHERAVGPDRLTASAVTASVTLCYVLSAVLWLVFSPRAIAFRFYKNPMIERKNGSLNNRIFFLYFLACLFFNSYIYCFT